MTKFMRISAVHQPNDANLPPVRAPIAAPMKAEVEMTEFARSH